MKPFILFYSFIHSFILLLIGLPTSNISGAQMVPTYGIIQAYSRFKDVGLKHIVGFSNLRMYFYIFLQKQKKQDVH